MQIDKQHGFQNTDLSVNMMDNKPKPAKRAKVSNKKFKISKGCNMKSDLDESMVSLVGNESTKEECTFMSAITHNLE